MEKYKEIERSIIKKYRKEIWRPFMRAVGDYQLINEKDKIMVCISGGKDSFLLSKCIEELKKHGKYNFEVKYVVMNPGYNKKIKDYILKNAEILNVDLELFESDIFEVVKETELKSPCYLCARMRRGTLYSKAQELGCNKIALGHHLDDVIETTLLSMFYGSEIKTMLPKLKSENFKGLELIRPLYLVEESNIIAWAKFHGLEFINCACPLKDGSCINSDSKRDEMKQLIKKLSITNPNIKKHIFTSMTNINLNSSIGYKKGENYYTFLDDYDK